MTRLAGSGSIRLTNSQGIVLVGKTEVIVRIRCFANRALQQAARGRCGADVHRDDAQFRMLVIGLDVKIHVNDPDDLLVVDVDNLLVQNIFFDANQSFIRSGTADLLPQERWSARPARRWSKSVRAQCT